MDNILTKKKFLNIDKSSWKLTTLGDLLEDISERVDNPAQSGYERFVGLEHFVSGDIRIRNWSTTENLTSSAKAFKAGDILFGRRNAYLRRASLVDFDGCCSGDAFVLRENHDKVVPGFMAFFFNSNAVWNFANENAAGTMSQRVKWRDLANYEFLLPPRGQQAQLAGLLWALDEVIEKERDVLEKTSIYIESVIQENLTSKRGGKTLNEYCEKDGIRIGPFGSLLHVEDYIKNGVPVIMPVNIIDGKIHTNHIARISQDKANELERYRVETNDIIFPRRGELSKRAIIREEQNGWICGTGSIRVRLKKDFDSKLAYYALTSHFVNSWLLEGSVGTTMPNLNASTISRIPLNLPGGQKAYDVLNEIELSLKIKDISVFHISRSQSLQKSLINQIF